MNDRKSVDDLHRSTIHGETPADPDRLLAFRPLDPTNRPAPFKIYPSVAPVLLPRQLRPSSLPAVDVLSGRRGDPQRGIDDRLLGTLLFLSAGVTRVARRGPGESTW